MDRRAKEDELEQQIIDYLSEHPHAADTAAGIADWWLTKERVGVALPMLEGVLDRLTQKGVLELIGKGEQLCYRLKTVRNA